MEIFLLKMMSENELKSWSKISEGLAPAGFKNWPCVDRPEFGSSSQLKTEFI